MNEQAAQRLAENLFEANGESQDSALPSIPGYLLHSSVGQGGGGVVFEGTVAATGRPVAIKLLHPRTAGNVSEALREFDRLAAVRSSVVPHVIEYGWHRDQIFIVTELIEGINPIQFAQPLKLRERVKLLAKIADAVHTLNTRGVLHRDLKPSNILITPDGQPVLLDLGIAALLGTNPNPNPSPNPGTPPAQHDEPNGPVQGTRQYMSPEQAQGRNTEYTTAWDVYALGVIGCELLATTPDPAEPASSSAPDANNTTPDPTLPKKLRQILSKACAHDPEKRYDSALQFRDDLRAWLNREPTIAGKNGFWAKTSRRFAARPILTVAVICLLMFFSSLGATGLLVRWQNTYADRFESIPNASGQSILTLYSIGGRILHRWVIDRSNAIGNGNRIVKWNDERLAIIGLGEQEQTTEHMGLLAYRVGEWDEPIWRAEQTVPRSMSHVTRYEEPPHTFRYIEHFFADVFPGNEDEIISLHKHSPSSLCAIQIHDTGGNLLSEYYHDGWIESAVWDPVHKQLILAGQNSDGPWEERGYSAKPPTKYPDVIFALRPQLGEIRRAIAHPGLGYGKAPRWYRCLMPPEAYEPMAGKYGQNHGVSLSSKTSDRERGQIKWQLGEVALNSFGEGHATLEIDSEGNLITAWKTDNWNGHTEYGLSPDVYRLEDLPPRIEERQYKQLAPEPGEEAPGEDGPEARTDTHPNP